MARSIPITIGNFLFRNLFPVYNIIYPFFKKRQDAAEIALLTQLIKPGFIIADIGANIGFYTKILSQLVGDKGRVIAFEPDTINFTKLKQNTSSLKNVTIENKAVSDKTGKLKIYTSKMLNVDHRTYPVDDYDQAFEIDAVSLDDYVNHSYKINIIKMDIQGAEPFALKGMIQVCIDNPDIIILTELWPWGLLQARSSEEEIKTIVKNMGMNIYTHSDKGFTSYIKPLHTEVAYNKFENIIISKAAPVL